MMKCFSLLFVLIALSSAISIPISIDQEGSCSHDHISKTPWSRTFIAPVGDIRAILGPQGKSITVCQHGSDVAVIYGDPTYDPTHNLMEVKVAYSTDSGATWLTYGPFSPEMNRIYPGLDGTPDFCTTPGGVYFTWQEGPSGYTTGDQKVMIEENVPSAPSFSTPSLLPEADSLSPWLPCIACAPDNPYYVITGSWSYLNGGNLWYYIWISTDGAQSWTDPIPVVQISSGVAGHFRIGDAGYVFMTYHDAFVIGNDTMEWPYFVESTDGGSTWGSETPLPVPYVDSTSQFWWHEFDCEVINNRPFAVHNDTGLDSVWLFMGIGSPGNWTWDVVNVAQVGTCSTWVGDTLFQATPGRHPCYPSIAYDEVSSTVLVSYWAVYSKALYDPSHNAIIETYYDGNHIGGIFSTDNGTTWHISDILSTPNIGTYPPMIAVETAHRLANIDGQVWAYSVWVDESNLYAVFEKGIVRPFYATGILENHTSLPVSTNFKITPTISRGIYNVICSFNKPGQVNINLFDESGRLITNVFSGYLQKGNHSIPFRTFDISTGTYFLILDDGTAKQTAKVIIVH